MTPHPAESEFGAPFVQSHWERVRFKVVGTKLDRSAAVSQTSRNGFAVLRALRLVPHPYTAALLLTDLNHTHWEPAG